MYEEEQDTSWSVAGGGKSIFRVLSARMEDLAALTTRGIFRVPGSSETVSALVMSIRRAAVSGQPGALRAALLGCDDVHVLAGALQRWLRLYSDHAPLIDCDVSSIRKPQTFERVPISLVVQV